MPKDWPVLVLCGVIILVILFEDEIIDFIRSLRG